MPQVATGQRRCTHKAKGFPLTRWTDDEFGVRPVRKVIGSNADERARAERSEGYSTDTRPIEYPLVEWGRGGRSRAVSSGPGFSASVKRAITAPQHFGHPRRVYRSSSRVGWSVRLQRPKRRS